MTDQTTAEIAFSDDVLQTPCAHEATFSGKTFYALSSDSYDVILLALESLINRRIQVLNDRFHQEGSYWAKQLWIIDRALRELGIED